jgi:hypothetical protein
MKLIYGSIALLLFVCGSASGSMISPPFNFFGGVNGSAGLGFGSLQLTEGVFDASQTWGVNFDVLPMNQPGVPVSYEVEKIVSNLTGTMWNTFGFAVNGGVSLVGGASINGPGAGAAIGFSGNNGYGWSNISVAPGETITVRFLVQTCANCTTGGAISQFAGISDVPEPASLALIGSSLTFLALLHRRLRR